MADWQFEEMPARFVQQNPTQRDQFNNDEVGLAEALVREAIQNSTDARSGTDPVKVRFAVHSLQAPEAKALASQLATLRPHLKECGVSEHPLDAGTARILVVEDFGTKGLTGDPGLTDGQNFHNFWRVHGGSNKGGTAGGRWGLGKLVYSSSSEIRAFFGLTVRHGDIVPLLMGQAVLRNHVINGKRYPPHGFWFGARGAEDIQLPVSDPQLITELRSLMKIIRVSQPGLSVVIPYLRMGIDEEAIIDAVLRNYYFPILAGQLVVEVGSLTISKSTFHAVFSSRPASKSGQLLALDFVEAVSLSLNVEPALATTSPITQSGISEKSFTPEKIKEMKALFQSGKLVQIRVPVKFTRKSGEHVDSSVTLFLQKLPEGKKPFSLFARGAITIPGESRYFGGVQAYGAMVARDKGVTEFLGDAENPAHTNWIATAEKLTDNWKSPGNAVRHIRYALKEVFLLIGEKVEHEDQNALLDLFSLIDPSRKSKGKKKRSPKPNINIPHKEKAISIKGRKGGFEIVAGPGALKWQYPKKIRVRVAYDTMVGNPFSSHSAYDFDLTKGDVEFNVTNAVIKPQGAGVLLATVSSPEFTISAAGFDLNRDIVVDARAA